MDKALVPSQKCLKLCILQWRPFISSIVGKEPNLKVSGIMVDLFDILARKLGTCVQYVLAKDRHYGIRLPNGTWTGIIGSLTRKEADMSGIVLSMDAERASAVTLSEPLFMDEQVVGGRVPIMEADVAGFVKPYTTWVWLIIGLTLVGVAGITFVVHFLSGLIYSEERPGEMKSKEAVEKDIHNSIWLACAWTVTAQLSQACHWWPKGDSVRVVTGLWLLMALILGSVYRSNLKAMLIMPRLRLPFNNIEELVNSGIPTLVLKGSMLNQAIEGASKESSLYQLKKQIVFTNRLWITKALKSGNTSNVAVVLGKRAFTPTLHSKYSDNATCEIYIAKESVFGGTSLCVAFPHGSPLKTKVDPIIRSLKEAGILEKLFSQGMRNASHCMGSFFKELKEPQNQLRVLSLGDFYGIFSIYVTGIVVSLIVFLVEFTSGLYQRKRHMNQQEISPVKDLQ